MTSLSIRSYVAMSLLIILGWIYCANCLEHITKTKRQMNSLYKSDPEMRKSYVHDLLATASNRTNSILYLLGKALAEKNDEFRLIKNSKINEAEAFLDVSNKAFDDNLDSVVNLTIVLRASKENIANDDTVVLSHVDSLPNLAVKPTEQSSPIKNTGKPNSFDKIVLEKHNFYRKKHGATPLTYSAKLSKVSQEWADYLATNNVFKHRPNGQYGENIYAAGSTNPKFKVEGNKPVDSWYSEIKYYSFANEPSIEMIQKTGHFTQLVWKGSRELGVGIAQSKKTKMYYIVCNYGPRGNYIGEFKKNVPMPKKK